MLWRKARSTTVRSEIQEHPTQILIRCTRPRELAAKMLEDEHIDRSLHPQGRAGLAAENTRRRWLLSGAERSGRERHRHRIDCPCRRRCPFRLRISDRDRRGSAMKRIWWEQIKAVIRLELRKTFFAKRGLWIYVVAALPVLLFLAYAIATSNQQHRSASVAAQGNRSLTYQDLLAVKTGMTSEEVIAILGKPPLNFHWTEKRRNGQDATVRCPTRGLSLLRWPERSVRGVGGREGREHPCSAMASIRARTRSCLPESFNSFFCGWRSFLDVWEFS